MICHIDGLPILSAAQMRAVEAHAAAHGTSADTLMELAGLEVARVARRVAGSRRINVVAGPGDNGGVAYVAARWLHEWRHDVYLVPSGSPKAGAAARAAAKWAGPTGCEALSGLRYQNMVLVEGTYDTAADGPVDRADSLDLQWIFAATSISIDLPSGLAPDTGVARVCNGGGYPVARWADITVALGALKPVHVLALAACGHLLVVDYGPRFADYDDGYICRIQDESEISPWVTDRPRIGRPVPTDHKYRSKVSVISGAMPGAARLAALGAVGASAGYVVLYGDATGVGPLNSIVHRSAIEIYDLLAGETGVVVVGPGLGRDERARGLLNAALAGPAMLVLDGDALTLLGDTAATVIRARSDAGRRTVLTPHEGEFARMFGDGGGNKIDRTIAASQACACAIVHKGACTVVVANYDCTVCVNGPTWLATAGTGDVLAGAIAAQLAAEKNYSGIDDAVELHARAAVIAGAAFSADRLAECLPMAIR